MNKKKNLLYHLLSFLLPFSCILLMFVIGGRYPFGSDTALESDAAIQYYPFTLLLRRIIRSGESLLYSWRCGLGINFWSMIAYYCVNIWTLVCVALPVSVIPLFLTLSIPVRLGLAGLFFSVLLRTIRPQLDLSASVFSGLYGLCMWYLVNFYQLIWLDTVVLTPLVLAGLIRLTRDRKSGLYTVSLFLSLIFNPYMSWMTCVMTGICWIGLLIILKKTKADLLRDAGRFFGHSLLAAGLGAVLLVPMACTLYESAAPDTGMPSLTQTEFAAGNILGRLVSFTFPILHIGTPNLSSSMLAVFLLFGYLTAKQIPIRERIFTGSVLAFLLLSLWYSPLNWFWHGFHTPHGFIHRFAHLVPLVLLYMGWRYTVTMSEQGNKRQLWRIVPMLGFAAATIIFSQVCNTTDIPVVCIVLVIIYAAIYALRMVKPKMRAIFLGMLLAVTSAETLLNAYLTASHSAKQFMAEDLNPDAEMQAAADAVKADAKANSIPVARTAMYPYRSYNPELLYDLRYGGSFYASLLPDQLCIFLGQLGFDSGSMKNYYFYQELPPVTMLLTGLRYVVMPNAKLPDSMYRQLGDTWGYAYCKTMPAGFCIPSEAGTLPTDSDYIEVQEKLFHALTDTDDALYELLQPNFFAQNGSELIALPESHTYRCRTGDQNDSLEFCFTAQKEGWYVYQLDVSADLADRLRNYSVNVGEQVISSDNFIFGGSFVHSPSLTQIGYLTAGEQVTVSLRVSDSSSGTVDVYAARLNEDAFEEGMKQISEHSFQLSEWADTRIRGSVQTTDDKKLLYLPIPYESGWTAYADGKKVRTERVYGAMIGIPLDAGSHEIELRFFPQGLVFGAIISAVSLVIAAILVWIRFRKTKQRQEV